MVSGVSTLALLATGDNAQTKAVYNATYQASANRYNILDQLGAAQKNLAAIEQDKITTNTQVRMNQDRAEAEARVNAAAAGVSGASVDDVIYNTKSNEALAIERTNKELDNQKTSELAKIGSLTSSNLAIQEPSTDYVGELMQAFSSLEKSDFEISESFQSEGFSMDALWGE